MRNYGAMKRLLPILLFFAASCSTIHHTPQADKICTTEFRMVRVQFKDTQGNNVTVTNFKAINKRTGILMKQPDDDGLPGYYTVASDADLHTLSTKGDIIEVSARDVNTGKAISGSYVISGGADACHIEKLSGPEVITVS